MRFFASTGLGAATMFIPRFSLVPVERRKFRREPKHQIVRLIFDGELTWVRGMLHNLSTSGACISISSRKKIPVEFTLLIPPNTQRRSRLVWHKGDKIGVEFVGE
jgi:hypothetical protein